MSTEDYQPDHYELPLGRLLWHIRTTDRSMQQVLRRVFAPTDVTKAQFGAMQVLNQVHSASSAALARTMTVTPQAMVGVIAALEEKGYIRRGSDPAQSARVLVAELTDAGREALERASRRLMVIDVALSEALTETEQDTLVELLEKMRATFTRVEASLLARPFARPAIR